MGWSMPQILRRLTMSAKSALLLLTVAKSMTLSSAASSISTALLSTTACKNTARSINICKIFTVVTIRWGQTGPTRCWDLTAVPCTIIPSRAINKPPELTTPTMAPRLRTVWLSAFLLPFLRKPKTALSSEITIHFLINLMPAVLRGTAKTTALWSDKI